MRRRSEIPSMARAGARTRPSGRREESAAVPADGDIPRERAHGIGETRCRAAFLARPLARHTWVGRTQGVVRSITAGRTPSLGRAVVLSGVGCTTQRRAGSDLSPAGRFSQGMPSLTGLGGSVSDLAVWVGLCPKGPSCAPAAVGTAACRLALTAPFRQARASTDSASPCGDLRSMFAICLASR